MLVLCADAINKVIAYSTKNSYKLVVYSDSVSG